MCIFKHQSNRYKFPGIITINFVVCNRIKFPKPAMFGWKFGLFATPNIQSTVVACGATKWNCICKYIPLLGFD